MFEGYVKGSLAKDESIKVRAKYHWVAWLEFVFVFCTLGMAAVFCWLLAAQMYADAETELAYATAAVGAVLAAFPFYVYLKLALTEMACTSRRVVFKTGIISIKTAEIKIDKIESIQIEQTFAGRILGYGDICFSGTGTAKVEFFKVDNPWQIKPQIEEAIDESLRQKTEKKDDDND